MVHISTNSTYKFVLVLFFLALTVSILANGRDLSLHQYTDKGEVAQITYAGRFISKCLPVVGFTAAKGHLGIILRAKRRGHPLLASPVSTISTDHGYAMCVIGLESDCSRVRRDWLNVVESDLFTFGEVPSLEKLSSRISSAFTKGLYREEEDAITRPLAASVLVVQKPAFLGGRDRQAKLRVLYNTGSVIEGVFGALGSVSEDLEAMNEMAALIEQCLEEEDRGKLKSLIDQIYDLLVAHIETKGLAEVQELEMEVAVCGEDGISCGLGARERAILHC